MAETTFRAQRGELPAAPPAVELDPADFADLIAPDKSQQAAAWPKEDLERFAKRFPAAAAALANPELYAKGPDTLSTWERERLPLVVKYAALGGASLFFLALSIYWIAKGFNWSTKLRLAGVAEDQEPPNNTLEPINSSIGDPTYRNDKIWKILLTIVSIVGPIIVFLGYLTARPLVKSIFKSLGIR